MKKWKSTFSVGPYRCKMTWSEQDGMTAVWDPEVPRRDLSEQEWDQYRAGRDALVARVAEHLGGSVFVVER